MTKDDVIRMAREAGVRYEHFNVGSGWVLVFPDDSLEKFVALAKARGAAEERNACLELLYKQKSKMLEAEGVGVVEDLIEIIEAWGKS